MAKKTKATISGTDIGRRAVALSQGFQAFQEGRTASAQDRAFMQSLADYRAEDGDLHDIMGLLDAFIEGNRAAYWAEQRAMEKAAAQAA